MTPEFYTAVEAARLIGVSEKTILRRMVKLAEPFPKNATGGYQIPLEWLQSQPEWMSTHPPDSDRTRPDDTGQTPPDTTGHNAVNESKTSPDITADSPDTRPDAIPDTTGQRALGRLEGFAAAQLGQAVTEALEPLQKQLEQMSESNRALAEKFEAAEASRAREIQDATASAVSAQLIPYLQRLDEVAQENAEVKAENERLKNRTLWQWLTGKG